MRCDRCHTKLKDGAWIYSQATRSRYCLDFAACDRRAQRKGLLPKKEVTNA